MSVSRIDSDSLLRFPELDANEKRSSNDLRDQIARQTAEFLAAGNKITQVEMSETVYKHQPIKRTKRAQINFIKRRDRKRVRGT